MQPRCRYRLYAHSLNTSITCIKLIDRMSITVHIVHTYMYILLLRGMLNSLCFQRLILMLQIYILTSSAILNTQKLTKTLIKLNILVLTLLRVNLFIAWSCLFLFINHHDYSIFFLFFSLYRYYYHYILFTFALIIFYVIPPPPLIHALFN